MADRVLACLIRVQANFRVDSKTLADFGNATHLTRQSRVRWVRQRREIVDRELEPMVMSVPRSGGGIGPARVAILLLKEWLPGSGVACH